MHSHDMAPKLVHKDSADDVLLRHPRPALPLELSADMAQSWMDAGAADLLSLYEPDVQPDAEGRASMRLALPAGSTRTNPMGMDIPADPAWQKSRAVPYQALEMAVSASQGMVLRAFEQRCGEARHAGASLAGLFRSSSYQMINSADHYFFYRKEHEHVPGVMLIEAQRQAVYAHLYAYTQHVRGDVTVSLNKLTSEFHGYVELMYPVELVVDDLGEDRGERPRRIDYRVSFYQRGKLVAVIDTAASVIGMTRFERLRNIFMHEQESDWYVPIRAEKVDCRLISDANLELPVEFISVSRHGCVTADDGLPLGDAKAIRIKSANGMEFSSEVVLEAQAGGNAVWAFVNTSSDRLAKMGEIIKRGFTLHQSTALGESV